MKSRDEKRGGSAFPQILKFNLLIINVFVNNYIGQ